MNDNETAKALNDFYSNIIKTVSTPVFNQSDTVSDNATDPIVKATLKCCKNPNILTIKEKYKNNSQFSIFMLH